MRTESPAPPRYGRASVADLLPSVLVGLGVEGHRDVLELGPLERVLVVVVDGLGWHGLHEHATLAPTLARHVSARLDAVFPTTTAASLSSIGTGRPPGLHGLVGYASALPGEDQPFNLLNWRIGKRGGGRDARDEVVPEEFQPDPTAFEQAVGAGVDTTVLLTPDFVASGLTRAALRGGRIVAVRGLEETMEAARAALAGPPPRLVYAYHGEVDQQGHRHGPASPQWREALAETEQLLSRTARTLPENTRLLVTADHGMLPAPEDEVVELADLPRLTEQVRVVAGEPRMRHLFTLPGRSAEEVAARWRDRLGDRATVLRRDDAIDHGLFGPEVAPRVRPLIGDVIVIARRGTLVHRDVDPDGGRLAGHHGGLDPAELEVPLIDLP